ncbi:MAG: hypothetical protein ACN6OP_10965 [Pseudomonadales bacterium]
MAKKEKDELKKKKKKSTGDKTEVKAKKKSKEEPEVKAKKKAKAGKEEAAAGKKKPFGGKGFPKKGSGAGKPKKKTKIPTWKAPQDFKTGFVVEWTFETEKDGMPGNRIRAIRFKGKYDPKADDKKKFDMMTYDVKTVLGIQARMSLTQFHATGKITSKGARTRLEPNTIYRALIRVGKKKADDTLTARVTTVLKGVEKKGKIKMVELDKKDVDYRKIRKANRYLPAAFRQVAALPERSRRKREDANDDEE